MVINAQSLDAFLEVLPEAAIVLNGNGIISTCNSISKNLLAKDIVGKAWFKIVQEYFLIKPDDGLEVSTKNGKRLKVTTNIIANTNQQLILLSDLTPTREYQEQSSLTERLTIISKLFSHLAHQIKTPIASVLLYLAGLENEHGDKEKKQTYLQKIKGRLNYLNDIVENLLSFAKSGEHTVAELTTKDIVTQLQLEVEDIVKKYHGRLIIINSCQQDRMIGNSNVLIGALLNLIENSLQSLDKDITITLYMYGDSEFINFVVADNGPGITTENLEKIQDSFFTTKPNGNGLGINIVKAIVAAHHGEFTISSTVGQGTQVGIKIRKIV